MIMILVSAAVDCREYSGGGESEQRQTLAQCNACQWTRHLQHYDQHHHQNHYHLNHHYHHICQYQSPPSKNSVFWA